MSANLNNSPGLGFLCEADLDEANERAREREAERQRVQAAITLAEDPPMNARTLCIAFVVVVCVILVSMS
jgi:hypothetical protein